MISRAADSQHPMVSGVGVFATLNNPLWIATHLPAKSVWPEPAPPSGNSHGQRFGRKRLLIQLLGTASMLAVSCLLAQAHAQTLDPNEARRQLEASRFQLEETQKRSKEIQSDVTKMREEREQLNTQLLDTAKTIQGSEGQLTKIESRLGELQAQEQLIRGSLEKSHGSISGLLAAMQRMGRNPPPVMVTRREDALTMVRSAMLLASAFPELRGQAQVLSSKLTDLVRVIDDTRRESENLRTEAMRLSDNRLKLTSLMETRKQTMAERQEELAQVRKAAAEISKSVTDLNELLRALDKTVSEKTRLGAYERQLAIEAQAQAQQQVAAAVPGQPPPAPAADAVPVSPVTPPATAGVEAAGKAAPAAPATRVAAVGKPPVELKPSITLQPGERLAMATPGRIQPAIPFEQAKGRLLMPAQGRQIQSFGDKAQSGRSDGIVIETRAGAQVVSPNDGWVMYAGEFRSYGQILIINAGGGYHVLLAGLSQIDVQVGQFVLAGEPVGVMVAAPKTASTKTQDTAPVLYVEFRKNQRPIDPGPWWTDNARKVAG